MKPLVSAILKDLAGIKNRKEKLELLKTIGDKEPVILGTLKVCFEPSIKILLPEGSPEFERLPNDQQRTAYWYNWRKMYLFIEGMSPNITQSKREQHFKDMIESMPEDEADLLISIKDKKFPYPGLDEKMVREVFPALFDTPPKRVIKEKKEEPSRAQTVDSIPDQEKKDGKELERSEGLAREQDERQSVQEIS